MKNDSHLDPILVLLPPWWRSVFVVFLGASFSDMLQFEVEFGVQFGRLCGVLGNLGNRFKTLKGVRFSHFGGPFCRHDFQARFDE